MTNNYQKREIFVKIIKYLEIPEILVLHGSRQVGKTTLMKMTIEYLRKKTNNDVFYFDLEDENYLNLCNKGVPEVKKYINARRKTKNSKVYLFIDEIQYLKNPTSLLKLFYDHCKNDYKLIVSGSSSFAIKTKFKDSLVGRIIDLEVFGLNFAEFLEFKKQNYNLEISSEKSDMELKSLYQEFIIYGAYPQVVLADSLDMKEVYIKNIIEKYIYKDIRDLSNIKNIEKFNTLLKFLASQSGQLVNLSELSSTLNIARVTIEEYLFILENTYIIKLIRPYHKNIRNELSKMPKVFFEDMGILNVLKNKKLSLELDGHFFENSVYNYLRRKIEVSNIHFWRTKSKQEVDFIIDQTNITPLEVKLTFKPKNMKNLIYFANNYHPNNIFCVTLNKDKESFKNIKQIYPWEIQSNLFNN